MSARVGFHHVEVWIADLERVRTEWGWLLGSVGFALMDEWRSGQSWGAGGVYLTLAESPNLSEPAHDRRRPGVNHLAFWAGDRTAVDALMRDASAHGWTPLYQDRYPHAGGSEHYAGWLENSDGFKVELVADPA